MSVGVAAHGVTYAYGPRRVLEDVSLELRGGELLALVGPNGAGKTTLLKLLAGLLRPRAGTVSAPQRRARLVAYLAQSEPLPGEFTALEVARLGRLPLQGAFAAEGAADRAAVERAMRRTGILDLAGRRVGTLSGGERQRVALARALAQEPRVLLLDEPTNHLDLAHQAELLRLLRDAANDGVAVAMVVHDLNLAALADRVALLHGGRLEAVGSPGEVLQPHRLERVYGARVERLTAPSGRAVVVFEP